MRRVTAAGVVLLGLAARAAAAPPPAPADVPAADVTVAVHDFGEFRIRLDPGAAPNAVAAFLSLAARGAYDSLTIHRVVPGLLVQTGNPATREGTAEDAPAAPPWRLPANPGAGDPGTAGVDSAAVPESTAASPEATVAPAPATPASRHRRGTVALAWRGGAPGSAGTEWYVSLADVPALDRHGTPIGEVVDGMDVVDRIAQVSTFRDRRPTKRILVTGVTVLPRGANGTQPDSATAVPAQPAAR